MAFIHLHRKRWRQSPDNLDPRVRWMCSNWTATGYPRSPFGSHLYMTSNYDHFPLVEKRKMWTGERLSNGYDKWWTEHYR